MVETVVRALKLPCAAITLGTGNAVAASYGLPVNEMHTLPLIYQGEPLGGMLVSVRIPVDDFTLQDCRMLERNDKPFVEYRFLSGLRLTKMLAHLAWMGMNKRARPPEQEFPVQPPFEPPLECGDESPL